MIATARRLLIATAIAAFLAGVAGTNGFAVVCAFLLLAAGVLGLLAWAAFLLHRRDLRAPRAPLVRWQDGRR